jgi:hypothetical protein
VIWPAKCQAVDAVDGDFPEGSIVQDGGARCPTILPMLPMLPTPHQLNSRVPSL